MKSSLTFRVIYRDTDAEGVVYYANYLAWMEAGRNEVIRNLGLSLKEIKEKDNIVFAVKNVNCDYLKPAQLDDEVLVESEISEIKPARLIFKQTVINKADKSKLTQAIVTIVAVDATTLKPTRIPKYFNQ